VIGVGGFFAALRWQMRSATYHPVRYWVTVLMVAVFGTMIADGPHVALSPAHGGLGWTTGVVSALGLALFAALVAYVALTHADEEGAHARRHHGDLDRELDSSVPELELD
jgi:uncharacterized membrane-anchored protein